MKEWVFYSMLALMTWGVWAFLPKFALASLDPKSAFIYEVIGGGMTGILAFCVLRPELACEVRGIIPAVLTGMAGYLGMLFFMFALRTGKVAIITPITALYPVVTIALGFIFLREKLNPVQITGIVLAVVSVFLITRE